MNFSKNYKNIFLRKNLIQSGSKIYVREFLKHEKKLNNSIFSEELFFL